jgi:hypothetical protein
MEVLAASPDGEPLKQLQIQNITETLQQYIQLTASPIQIQNHPLQYKSETHKETIKRPRFTPPDHRRCRHWILPRSC